MRFAVAFAAVVLAGCGRYADFTLPAPGGKTVKLADLTAKGPVVVFTFIQAFTGT